MGFRKRNANKSDNCSKSKVVMGKPASQLTKEDKKILSARMAEIKSANGGKTTVQNTIPYMCMYKDGVCQVSENFFSMTVQFYDANYSISEFEEQNNIFSKYCDVINLFDNTIKFQLTFENQNRSKEKLLKTVQIPEQKDDFNAIRKEYSEMLTDKLMKGSNGQSARKFLTFGIESTSYKAARAKLLSIKNDVIKGFKVFGVEAKLLDGRQRLEALYYIHDAKTEQQKADLFDNINSNYGRFNSCFLCPRSFEGISFVGQRLVDQLIKDMDRSRKVAVTWVSIDLDVLDKLQSHFTGELLCSCVGLHTADILVHITLVLPCRFGTLSQLVLFGGQLILLCLILFKQADTHLFGNFACHLILVDALDKTVKLVDTLHNIVLPFPV